jgi:carbonic anhydrase
MSQENVEVRNEAVRRFFAAFEDGAPPPRAADPTPNTGESRNDNKQPNIEPALERNRAFAAAGGHEGAVVFPNLRLFVITCLDPRVDPAHFLGLDLSDAMVVRNVGGRVTPEVINDVAFIGQLAENALPDGPLFEAAVIHHTQCGSGALADDTFRHRYAERIGAEESTLREHAVLDPAATVTRDVERLRSAPPISARVAVSGHVYDVVTGLVETVVPVSG